MKNSTRIHAHVEVASLRSKKIMTIAAKIFTNIMNGTRYPTSAKTLIPTPAFTIFSQYI
jgi:hypothetical protein